MSNIKIYDFLDFFEGQHDFFRALIDHSEIELTESIDTACVAAENKKIIFKINPVWWEKETPLFIDKCFIIAHEMAHVLFKHLAKLKTVPEKDRPIMNVAMDLFINQLICDFFDIPRKSLSPSLSQNACWVDTVFPNRQDIDIERGTDYYFHELLVESMAWKKEFEKKILEMVHSLLGENDDVDDKELEDILNSIAEEVEDFDFVKSLMEGEISTTQNLIAGKGRGSEQRANVEKVKVKKRWETVITKWCKSKVTQKRNKIKRWGFVNRKFDNIACTSNYLFQGDPSIIDRSKLKEKNSIALFLDTSGSCINLKHRFVSAAASIPKEFFDIHVATFDTKVKKIFDDKDSSSKIRHTSSWSIWGGGGTSFDIIERYLQSLPKYPDAIFVITDGYGDSIYPEFPERFHWFLTKYNCKSYIPIKSKMFMLDNFV